MDYRTTSLPKTEQKPQITHKHELNHHTTITHVKYGKQKNTENGENAGKNLINAELQKTEDTQKCGEKWRGEKYEKQKSGKIKYR